MTWNGFGVGVLAVAAAATARGQCPNQAFSMTEHAVGGTPAGVTAGDFNGDGVADIATCLSAGNSVSVLYGTGGGAFAGVVGVPTGAGPVAVVSADFNGDGRADLVTANAGAGNLSVLLSTGSGFAPAAAVSFGAGTPTCLAVGDANGDSRLDVIVGRAGNATLVTMLGDGAGGLAPGGSSSTLSNVSGLAAFYGAAPQDPFLDIATVSSTSLMTAQQGLGNGNFATIQMLTVGQTPQGVATADFDLDGRADIVGSSQSEGAAYVFYGHLQGFSGRDFAGNAQIPRAVATGDFNDDGRPDIAACGGNTPFGQVAVIRAGPDRTFNQGPQAATTSTVGALTIADFNGDGYPDIAGACEGGNVAVLINTGPFAAKITQQPVSNAVELGATATLAVTGAGTGTAYQWRRQGVPLADGGRVSGSHTPVLTITGVEAADDGVYDVVVSNACTTEVSQGAYISVRMPACGSADFDGDGDVGTDADIEAFFRVLAGGNC